MIPQLIYLAFMLTGLGLLIEQHGKLQMINAFSSIFAQALTLLILYWGGFFDVLLKGGCR